MIYYVARKKTGTPVIQISSVIEAKEFLRKYQALLVGWFDKFEASLNQIVK